MVFHEKENDTSTYGDCRVAQRKAGLAGVLERSSRALLGGAGRRRSSRTRGPRAIRRGAAHGDRGRSGTRSPPCLGVAFLGVAGFPGASLEEPASDAGVAPLGAGAGGGAVPRSGVSRSRRLPLLRGLVLLKTKNQGSDLFPFFMV